MKKRRLLCLLMCLPLLIAARAETLTIGQCVEAAREHYPAIAQYGLIDKAAQFGLENASKAWLPQGTVSAQGSWQNDVARWPEQFAAMLAQQGVSFPGIDKLQYRVGVDVTQQIWDGGKTAATSRAIASQADVDSRTLDVQLYDVEGRVQELYFAVLLLEGRIRSVERSMALTDSVLAQTRVMMRNGVAMQSDCDQIEAKLLALGQQMVQLSATRQGYRRVLEIFIGEPVGERQLMLPQDEPVAPSERPQLRLFDARLDNVAAQEHAVRSSAMPQIGAFASGYYGYPGYNMFKNMQTRTPSVNLMVGVKATWNFGALYTRRNSLNRLQLQRQQIETGRETFLFNNEMAESEGLARIGSLREVIKSDARIVELRRSVICAARSQLRNGVIDPTSLLTKITDAELAENDLILHEIELTQAIYNLNHIRNK